MKTKLEQIKIFFLKLVGKHKPKYKTVIEQKDVGKCTITIEMKYRKKYKHTIYGSLDSWEDLQSRLDNYFGRATQSAFDFLEVDNKATFIPKKDIKSIKIGKILKHLINYKKSVLVEEG